MKGDWPYPSIVAHRGGGRLAPENTLAAIRAGQSLGYRMHEFDVKLSRDGVAFLLHDTTLERTTNGHGPAAARTWEELARLDAGAWHSETFRGEPPPRFEAAAQLLIARGTLANIEIKPSPGREAETGDRVARLADGLWAKASVPPLLSSFSFDALMAAKSAVPRLPRGFITSKLAPEDRERLAALGAVSLHTNHRRVARHEVERLREAGYRVLLYTVDEPERAEALFGWGVDGIFTDNLEVFAGRFPERI